MDEADASTWRHAELPCSACAPSPAADGRRLFRRRQALLWGLNDDMDAEATAVLLEERGVMRVACLADGTAWALVDPALLQRLQARDYPRPHRLSHAVRRKVAVPCLVSKLSDSSPTVCTLAFAVTSAEVLRGLWANAVTIVCQS